MDRETLEAWLEEGLSLEQIGRRVGRHPSTVAYWLQKHGLSAAHRARHAARGGIPRGILEQLVARELTTREIAEELDRSLASVRYWLGRHGLRVIRARGVVGGVDAVGPTVEGDCPRHGPGLFTRRRDGAWRCLRCRAELVARRRRKVKEILVADAGGGCVLCGYRRCVGALHFHHVDPAKKSFDVSRVGVTLSVARAREEARKCVLLCSNCHAEVEGGVAAVPAKLAVRAADYPR